MRRKLLRELAESPQFIPGVYNYCDRWCERCPLSHRCLTYAMEKAEDDGDPEARDLNNQKFWDKLQEQFRENLQLALDLAKAQGVELNDPELQAEVKAQERAERRLAATNRGLGRIAMNYFKAAGKWFDDSEPLFHAKGVELETLARLETGDPFGAIAELSEFVEVIRWYQPFIYVKLRRAVESRAGEELEQWDERKAFPKDSDGSAKIALIAIDRSIAAWTGLRSALGEDADSILDLLSQLAAIRVEAEKVFPNARSFVRPGFDAPYTPELQALNEAHIVEREDV